MTNLLDILINAPKGLELYTPVFGKVYFQGIEDNLIEGNSYPIIVIDENDKRHSFTENGEYLAELDTECVLFPSKEHRIWDNWQDVLFQRGDVIVSIDKVPVLYYEDKGSEYSVYNKYSERHGKTLSYLFNCRYAFPEERDQFFKELNANGYTWNADTKQIERIEQKYTPKYKVGDWIICTDTNTNDEWFYESDDIIPHKITSTKDHKYEIDDECIVEDTKEFDTNTTIRLATEQELIDAGIKEKPFTIDDLKPFDKVLVKDDYHKEWDCDLFSHFKKCTEGIIYYCISCPWKYCIPYNDETKHLLGTTDDCPDKYKTW